MPWGAPAFGGAVLWVNSPDTPLDADKLNLSESEEAAYAVQVGQSVVNYFDAPSPNPVLRTPTGVADQDLLVRSGSTWARLAVGPRGTQMIVRQDGTLSYVEPMGVNARAWGVSPLASSSANLTNLQAAITQATANSGAGDGVTPAAKVELPAGKIVVNGPLLVKFALHFYGTGGMTTTIQADDYGDKTTARTNYTAGGRSTFPAILKWDGGDVWAHGVHVVGINFDTNGIEGLSATWFQSPGEHSWFHDLACSNTAPVPRTLTDAQIVGNNKTVTFAASTFTEDDVNALVTDRPDGDHTQAGPTIPAFTKIDLVNYANPGYQPQATDTATSITLSKAATGAANPSSFTVKQPTDAFVFEGGFTPALLGQFQGVTNSGALLRLKGVVGTCQIAQLSGDDNLGGMLRISRDAAGAADPAHIIVHQIKAESDQYNPNWQAAHDPVILVDRCSFLNLTIEHGNFTGGQFARDVLRIDQEWSSWPQQFGGVSAELDIEGANPDNVQFTNLVHDSTSGEVIEAIPESFVQAGRGRGFFAKILWNKDLLIGGGGRVPALEPWVAGGVYYTQPVWNNCSAIATSAEGSAIPFAGGIVWYNGANLLNDSMSWLDDLAAGTYDLGLAGARQAGNGIITVDFGVKIVPTPPAPGGNVSSVAGTGPPAGFYFVQYAYVTANGETVPGPSTQINMDGAHSMQIASPVWPDVTPLGNPIIGWYAYVTAAGGGPFYRQQAAGAPTPLLTDYLITGAVATTGAAPATKDTSGVWSTVGTWDQYAAAGDITFQQFSGIVVPPHSGPVQLRFTVTGQNAANTTGYSMNISARHWQRTS